MRSGRVGRNNKSQPTRPPRMSGAEGDRTPDLLNAIQLLRGQHLYCLVLFGCIVYGKPGLVRPGFPVLWYLVVFVPGFRRLLD